MSYKVCIVTPQSTWFSPFAFALMDQLKTMNCFVEILEDHKLLSLGTDLTFFLSYPRLVKQADLDKSKLNVVAHASALPKGRGWSPWVWQILEGSNEIPITLFEVQESLDSGPILLQDFLVLSGSELIEILRDLLGKKINEMCLKLVEKYQQGQLEKIEQGGEPTYYAKRTAAHSELSINKTIADQFNLFRVVDNEAYPAFFYLNGKKYILKIFDGEK